MQAQVLIKFVSKAAQLGIAQNTDPIAKGFPAALCKADPDSPKAIMHGIIGSPCLGMHAELVAVGQVYGDGSGPGCCRSFLLGLKLAKVMSCFFNTLLVAP